MKKTEGIKYDGGKFRMSLLPQEAIEDILEVLEYGAIKYSPDGWKDVKPKKRYLDAAYRHLGELRKGNLIDLDIEIEGKIIKGSGLKHIQHAITSLIMYSELCKNK